MSSVIKMGIAPDLRSESAESTISRSKLIEAQQRALIKKRLSESPPLHDLDDEEDEEVDDAADEEMESPLRFQQSPSQIARVKIPPPLNFTRNQKYVPVSIKTAPMRVNYRKSIMMKKLQFHNFQNSNYLMVPGAIPRSSTFDHSYSYKRRSLARTSPTRITKTTLLKPAAVTKAPIKTPISLTTGKQVKTPIVADILQDKDNKLHNKLAPLESQPMSSRREYFAFSDGEVEEQQSSNCPELEDFDVESCAIEENASETSLDEIQKAVKGELKLGDKTYTFEYGHCKGHLQDAKTLFLDKCAAIWNEHLKQATN